MIFYIFSSGLKILSRSVYIYDENGTLYSFEYKLIIKVGYNVFGLELEMMCTNFISMIYASLSKGASI